MKTNISTMKKPVLLLLLLIHIMAKANITLPAVIGSNMVLQQQSSARFWGWGNANEKVFITPSWNNSTDSATVTGDGKWQVNIATPKAGGPYNIIIKGGNSITLTNILVGEVWVCSGQSNMEYNYYWGLPDIQQELPHAANANIRFFNIPRTTALYPQEDCRAQWTVCDSNTIKSFSGVGYFFGKRLNQALDVPVGLINASWGGTPAEVWMQEQAVNSDSLLKQGAAKLSPTPWWPVSPGLCFNGMIAPVTPYAIAGAIWYQGEGNTTAPEYYERLFPAMIRNWRQQWNKEIPFYYVQIAPYTYGNKPVGALIQEAQLKTLSLPNTGMAVISDLVTDTSDIHPKNKRDVGLRLANLALENTYRKKFPATSPVYKKIEVKKDKVVIAFNHVYTGLVVKGKAVTPLLIAGDDQIFYPAESKVEGDRLTAWSKKVKNPVAVRYAFGNTAIGNLFSREGLPVSPFRTDHWNE
jgi:sialate O-acetylesterase